jgi:DNA-binding LytR/AlgR family response regulator
MKKQFFFYREEGLLKKIPFDEILLIQAENNYVKFHSLEYSHMVRISFTTVLNHVPADRFVQIHRSYIVAIDQVETIGKDYVSFEIKPPNRSEPVKVQLPLSKKFYPELIKRVTIIETPSTGSET